MWRVRCSRWINYRLLHGQPHQMVSTRCYVENRYGWLLCIDWWFYTLRGERNHCYNSFYVDQHYGEKGDETKTSSDPSPQG